MTDTVSTYDGLLKQIYTDDKVLNLIYDNNPFLAMVDKFEGFEGDALKVGIIYGGNAATSTDFSTSQTLAGTNSQNVTAFLVTSRATKYNVTNWSRETMLASASDAGAFLRVNEVAIDNAIRELGNALAADLYRTGYGEVGQIGSPFSASGTTIQLSQPEDVVNFSIDESLNLASTVNASSYRTLGSSGNGLIITGVDRSSGILTFGFPINDATNGIPTIAVGDFIFPFGTTVPSASPAPRGIQAWVPFGGVGVNDSFWTVNRSQDSRLSGLYLDARSGNSIEEALIDGAELASREGSKLSHYFMSFGTYSKLLKEMQGRVVFATMETEANVSFEGVQVITGMGKVLCVPDRSCPTNRIFGLDLSTWQLATLGKMVSVVDEDGMMIQRVYNADAFQARYTFYGQLVCRGPGRNVTIAVTP